ncbi:hypothetical protein OC842_006589 [Tilletia horrida]|uniref:Alpha/beta hydrolase fold-3 domain-containing protein n=1 Tax=Tilletia horrida TaxID=155126 RepID=A0AAN6G5U6_9BASI|nr:hypothetical protein OC842_006589 [Tilletia horrida]
MVDLPHHPATVKTELSLKLPAHLLRGVQRLVDKILPTPRLPDGVVVHRIEVPSRDTKGEAGPRYILVDVYESQDAAAEQARTKPVPVHISLHGSGFVTPNLGQDIEFTSWLAAQPAFLAEGAVVFDTDYRKAPEHPFPAPLEDVEDVIRYVFSKPDIYDRSRITLGGFSAGATLSLSASYTVSSGVAFPGEDIKIPIAAVSSAYPATDMRPDDARDSVREPLTKVDKSGAGAALPKSLTDWFTKAYLVDEKDAFDKRVSVTLLDQQELPRHVLVAAGEADSLFPEAKHFVDKLQSQGHPDATFLNVGAEGHGFDKHARTLVSQLHTDALNVKMLQNILRGWEQAKEKQTA